ncbi:MAG: cryptochrome/photolyase family protein [Blastochloris sp.]|nr:cryptochrome/photolyase family protein [Blastochloris sp.]
MHAFWILGDQLSPTHPALKLAKSDDIFLLLESSHRAGKLRYHQHKLVLLYSAMRHYAEELRQQGFRVHYHALEDGPQDYLKSLQAFVQEFQPESITVMQPNEWAMQEALPALSKKIKTPIQLLPSNQFLVSRDDFQRWASGKKSLLMASHYQTQRRRLNILIDEQGEPEGGQWSYDSENREGAKSFARQSPSRPPAAPAPTRRHHTQRDQDRQKTFPRTSRSGRNFLAAGDTPGVARLVGTFHHP